MPIENNQTKKGGIATNMLVFPYMIFIVILFAFVVLTVMEVNRSTNDLTDMMQRYTVYQQDITDLQAGVGVLSDTSIGFTLTPVLPNGQFNEGPLKAFVAELDRDRRGWQIAERFAKYDINPEIYAMVKQTGEYADELLELQLHNIALLRSIYTLSEDPRYDALPEVELPQDELARPEEARLGLSKQIIFGSDYSQLKNKISENTIACGRMLQEEFDNAIHQTQEHIARIRTILWIDIAVLILVTAGAFVCLFFWFIRPLRIFSRQIASDEQTTPVGNIKEVLTLSTAYNALLSRRNRLEEILRSAAETDALTGMPNRYSMERYALEIADKGGSLAVLLFDVNFLKRVNDTEGHQAGDRLLRNAGNCICECFAMPDEHNCYRIGGDEFSAILRGNSEEEIRTRIERFRLALEREKISISVGYGFTGNANEDSFKALLSQADKNMYEEKKHVHELEQDQPDGGI